ncbi:cell differentiation family, Rcd1 [Trichuris suis]|nr:cell differentiation family, Rcd1 [Trichuris suis]
MSSEPEFTCVSDHTSTLLVNSLLYPETRNESLWKLVRWQNDIPDLALKLWCTPNVVTILLFEMCSLYKDVQNKTLTTLQSKMACNIIELIKCIASHPVTRMLCLQVNLPAYLQPFMSFVPNEKIYEKPCALCLNVLSTLLQANDQAATDYVLKMDFVNVCLHTMNYGSVYLKTTGVYTMLKFLETELGFSYVRNDASQISKIIHALGIAVQTVQQKPVPILLKFTLRCYSRLSTEESIRDKLRKCLPQQLKDDTLKFCFGNDQRVRFWIQNLLNEIYSNEATKGVQK